MRFAPFVGAAAMFGSNAAAQITVIADTDNPAVLASRLVSATNDRLSAGSGTGQLTCTSDCCDGGGPLPGAFQARGVSLQTSSTDCSTGPVPGCTGGLFDFGTSNNYDLRSPGIMLSTDCARNYGTGPNDVNGNSTSFGVTTEPPAAAAAIATVLAALPSSAATASRNDLSYLATSVTSCSRQPIAVEIVFGSEEWFDFVDDKADAVGILVNGQLIFASSVSAGVVAESSAVRPETELNAVQVIDVFPTGSPPETTSRLTLFVPGALAAPAGPGFRFDFEFLIWDADDDIYDSTLYVSQVRSAADVNADGQVTAADFNAWIAAFNDGDLAADQNGDGLLTSADFNAWVINFNANCNVIGPNEG